VVDGESPTGDSPSTRNSSVHQAHALSTPRGSLKMRSRQPNAFDGRAGNGWLGFRLVVTPRAYDQALRIQPVFHWRGTK